MVPGEVAHDDRAAGDAGEGAVAAVLGEPDGAPDARRAVAPAGSESAVVVACPQAAQDVRRARTARHAQGAGVAPAAVAAAEDELGHAVRGRVLADLDDRAGERDGLGRPVRIASARELHRVAPGVAGTEPPCVSVTKSPSRRRLMRRAPLAGATLTVLCSAAGRTHPAPFRLPEAELPWTCLPEPSSPALPDLPSPLDLPPSPDLPPPLDFPPEPFFASPVSPVPPEEALSVGAWPASGFAFGPGGQVATSSAATVVAALRPHPRSGEREQEDGGESGGQTAARRGHGPTLGCPVGRLERAATGTDAWLRGPESVAQTASGVVAA